MPIAKPCMSRWPTRPSTSALRPRRQSYLLIDKILDACKLTGAEAVHTGYGFLSEREAFPVALEKAGIVFIGPNARSHRGHGRQDRSKKARRLPRCRRCPATWARSPARQQAVKIAEEIGYPVMMKASAGGGGKGCASPTVASEVEEGFPLAKSRRRLRSAMIACSSRSSSSTRAISRSSCIGDKHGNVVYLGERECSIQRRNQKVIEEAPSPLLDEKTRKAMGEQAVALAKAVGYDSAGTVEFVAGQDRSFFFLEMNTRLQVEHPVDRACHRRRSRRVDDPLAAGEKLSFKQSDVKLNGWAVESRVYAEDPSATSCPPSGAWLSIARLRKGRSAASPSATIPASSRAARSRCSTIR